MKSFRNVLRTRDSDGTPKSSRLRPDGRISPSHNNVLPLGMPPVTGQSSALYEVRIREPPEQHCHALPSDDPVLPINSWRKPL